LRFFASLRFVQNDKHLQVIDNKEGGLLAAKPPVSPPLCYDKLTYCHSDPPSGGEESQLFIGQQCISM